MLNKQNPDKAGKSRVQQGDQKIVVNDMTFIGTSQAIEQISGLAVGALAFNI